MNILKIFPPNRIASFRINVLLSSLGSLSLCSFSFVSRIQVSISTLWRIVSLFPLFTSLCVNFAAECKVWIGVSGRSAQSILHSGSGNPSDYHNTNLDLGHAKDNVANIDKTHVSRKAQTRFSYSSHSSNCNLKQKLKFRFQIIFF